MLVGSDAYGINNSGIGVGCQILPRNAAAMSLSIFIQIRFLQDRELAFDHHNTKDNFIFLFTKLYLSIPQYKFIGEINGSTYQRELCSQEGTSTKANTTKKIRTEKCILIANFFYITHII